MAVKENAVTVGDFTYTVDEAGNVRRRLCDHDEAYSCGPGCEDRVLSEHEIPRQVLRHFNLG